MATKYSVLCSALIIAVLSGCGTSAPDSISEQRWAHINAQDYLRENAKPSWSRTLARSSSHSLAIFHSWRRNLGMHYHAEHDKLIHVLDGTGTIVVAGETITVKPGDVFSIPRGTVHGVQAIGKEPLTFLYVYSPPMDGADHHVASPE